MKTRAERQLLWSELRSTTKDRSQEVAEQGRKLTPRSPCILSCTRSESILSPTLVSFFPIGVQLTADTPLTYDQLVAPDSTYTIIRPLTDKYIALQNPSVGESLLPRSYDCALLPSSRLPPFHPFLPGSVRLTSVFCLLLNRVQFISDSAKLSIATLSESRATLCEIIAIRVLRGWSERSLHLATVLLTPWPLFQGAPSSVITALKDDGEEEVLEHSATALEMAIISVSKRFIRSPSCQKVIGKFAIDGLTDCSQRASGLARSSTRPSTLTLSFEM